MTLVLSICFSVLLFVCTHCCTRSVEDESQKTRTWWQLVCDRPSSARKKDYPRIRGPTHTPARVQVTRIGHLGPQGGQSLSPHLALVTWFLVLVAALDFFSATCSRTRPTVPTSESGSRSPDGLEPPPSDFTLSFPGPSTLLKTTGTNNTRHRCARE